MLKKYLALLVMVTASTSCTIVDYPQKKTQNDEKNYDDIAVYVKDGLYKCEYLTAIDSGTGYGVNVVDNGKMMMLRTGRISDLNAYMAVILSTGASYSSKGLRLQKPEKNGTQYLEEPDFLGKSGRPGMTFRYNYLDNGKVELSAAISFVDGFQSMSMQTNWCKEVSPTGK